jgi:hypothetical protein
MEAVMLQENSKVSESGTSRKPKKGRASRTARKPRRSGRAAPRRSLYDEVTAQIIAQLEEGVFPWVRPWSGGNAVTGLPRNAISGRHYSGINILILWGAVIDGAYPSQDWLTFRQALAAGGCVRKGEKGRTVFYANRFTPDEEGSEQKNKQGEGDAPRSIPFLKRFTVFNAAQCDGLPERFIAEPAPLPQRELHDQAEGLIAATGADFRNGGARAFYSPSGDYVQVPPQPLARTWSLDGSQDPPRPRSIGRLWLRQICAGRIMCRTGLGFSMRCARYRAYCAPCRLSGKLAGGIETGQPRYFQGSKCRE